LQCLEWKWTLWIVVHIIIVVVVVVIVHIMIVCVCVVWVLTVGASPFALTSAAWCGSSITTVFVHHIGHTVVLNECNAM